MKKPVCDLRILIHIDNIKDQHTADFTGNHVALRDRFFFSQLLEETFSMLRPVTFELHGYNRCKAPFDTIGIDNSHDPLDCAYPL